MVAKQVRLVLKSPSWITHESTSELFQRYNFEDPIAQLARALEVRRAKPSLSVVAFDTPERQQWHSLLPSFFALPLDIQDNAALHPSSSLSSRACLQEVTGVLSQTFQCPSCPQTFATLIALRTHFTKSHVNKSDSNVPESCIGADAQSAQPASHTPTVATTKRTSQPLLREQFMRYAKDGMPTCALCLSGFAAWPPFLNRHHTNSCPAIDHADMQSTRHQVPSAASAVIHASPADSPPVPPAASVPVAPPLSPTTAQAEDSGPLISRRVIRDLAAQDDWMPLAHYLRDLHTRAALHHCPVCHQWLTRTQDIFRHLKKQHPLTKIQDSLRADWLQARTAAARSPCSWCKASASYKTQPVAACPVLQQSITLHLLIRHKLGLSCEQRKDPAGCPNEGSPSRTTAPSMLGRRPGGPGRAGVLLERRSQQEEEELEDKSSNKWARPESKGGFGRGGRGKGNQASLQDRQSQQRQAPRRSMKDRPGKDIEGMMWMLGRLLRRHEDQMGIDKTENNFVMFFKKDSALSLVPTFVKKAEHWHSLKEQKQAKMDELALPLRTFLFHSMLEALLLRLKETTQSQDQLSTAMTLLRKPRC